MAEKVNYIGSEYLVSFESVVSIVTSGCLQESDLDISVERDGAGTRIVDRRSKTAFVCGGTSHRAAENAIAMEKDGATWFAALRGEPCEFPNSAWLALIDKVATAYHKRYSFVEYKQRKRDKKELDASRKYGKDFADNFTRIFYPALGEVTVAPPASKDGDDIYGVSVRLGLSGGTGEAQPVLGRVYFRREDDRMYPLESRSAKQIEAYISDAVLSADDQGVTRSGGRDDTAIRATLNALNDLVYPRTGSSRFAQCLCFSKHPGERESRDELVIKELTEKMLNAQKTLECKSLKVLGITHVKWENTVLDIVAKEKRIFRVLFGPDGSVSLSCLNCLDGGLLIENNVINYEKEGERFFVTIDPAADDLGLDKEMQEEVRANVFADHLKTISCNVRGTNCKRLACKSQTVSFGENIDLCARCPYPEIVWRDEAGTAYVTSKLSYAFDRMTLIPKEETETCACCGRGFSKEGMTHGKLCRFCAAAQDPDEETKERAEKNYKRYALALPVTVRMASAGKKKYCFEDDGVLLFVVGGRAYLLDKLELRSEGYLAKAKRLQSFGGSRRSK